MLACHDSSNRVWNHGPQLSFVGLVSQCGYNGRELCCFVNFLGSLPAITMACLTKSPNEKRPDKIPKYAEAGSHVWRLKTALPTSVQEKLSSTSLQCENQYERLKAHAAARGTRTFPAIPRRARLRETVGR